MEIRSITQFIHPGSTVQPSQISAAAKFGKLAQRLFEDAGYIVQSQRLATTPFPKLFPNNNTRDLVNFAQNLETEANSLGIAYCSLGPALPEFPFSYQQVPEILAATQNIFAGGSLVTNRGEISLASVRASAEIIHTLAGFEPNGFGNLYFAALANVPAGAPFFPAAYHQGEQPAFALAMEAADLAVLAFSDANSLAEARLNLVRAIETHASILSQLALKLSSDSAVNFLGLDFTLAPYPSPERSLGTALEYLGLSAIGMQGSLAAAAFLADTIDQARYLRTGFNGLMLPVLEDATLAARAAQGTLSVNDLLMYSAVCGTGLDTVPLPGSTSIDEIYAVLLDLAALALRLDKPLTARLMPIPGKQAGEPTSFDFPYFANSRVLPLKTSPLSSPLAGSESIVILSRPQNGYLTGV
jgi:uncharacterized protein